MGVSPDLVIMLLQKGFDQGCELHIEIEEIDYEAQDEESGSYD